MIFFYRKIINKTEDSSLLRSSQKEEVSGKFDFFKFCVNVREELK